MGRRTPACPVLTVRPLRPSAACVAGTSWWGCCTGRSPTPCRPATRMMPRWDSLELRGPRGAARYRATGFVGGSGWPPRSPTAAGTCAVSCATARPGEGPRRPRLPEPRGRRARRGCPARRGRGRRGCLPDPRDGGAGPGATSKNASGRARNFAEMAKRKGIARRLPGRSLVTARVATPAQPAPNRRDPLRAGAAAHLLPRRDDRGRGRRVLHASLPRAAAAAMIGPAWLQGSAGDRDRRRDRLPLWRRLTCRLRRSRGADRGTRRVSPTARCSI